MGAGVGGVVWRVVGDEREARVLGMRGSPTLLVDGVDPFAGAGEVAGFSCRLYRDAAGGVSGAPGEDRLREVLSGR